jgi:hypothetical protein
MILARIRRLAAVFAGAGLVACGGAGSRPASPQPQPTSRADTPCISGPPLAAADIHQKLERYAWSLYDGVDAEPPPPTTFGSCSVERNVVRAADGSVVAELGCGVRVLKRGIRDDLGLEIGAHGRDVLARKRRPLAPLTCLPNGPDQARCRFDRDEPDVDLDPSWYVVAGRLDETLTGEAATAFFAPRELVELHVSMWCH